MGRFARTALLVFKPTLHPEKTRIVDATQRGGFDFLGSLRAGHEMATPEEPSEVESSTAGQALPPGRAESGGDRGEHEPERVGLHGYAHAQQGQNVRGSGWVCAKTTAEFAAMTAGGARGWAGSGAPHAGRKNGLLTVGGGPWR